MDMTGEFVKGLFYGFLINSAIVFLCFVVLFVVGKWVGL
jgi:hypothetical protein